ncbi:MAG: two-component sensor histidine kinase [Lachnospiraceae bacterium]|nr:two-component sensor histidine kinase [Lachnospiraceae bacterium]
MKKKISRKLRYTIILGAVFSVLLLLALVMSRPFLNRFFEKRRIVAMKSAHRQIEDAFANGSYDSGEFEQEFKLICERYNVNIVVIDYGSQTLMASSSDYKDMNQRLLGYIFEKNEEEDDLILENDTRYELRKVQGESPEEGYIDMWGVMENGDLFLIRSPMEGIHESARIAESFLLYFLGILGGVTVISLVLYTRRITAEELRETNERLMEDIRKREELEEMRSEFLSNVSHELKTPIALIRGYAEGLKEGVSEDPESRDYYCEVIMDEAEKMDGLVKKLLDLNSIEFGERKVEKTVFDLTGLIRDYLNDASILGRSKNITPVFDDSSPCMVFSDENGIEEVFNNYFSNALNHVSEDGRIEIRLVRSGDIVRMSVFNTGDPIPEESIPFIWDKFYKVDKARTRKYGGSGVGLSIVKAIMESVQGGYGVINYESGVEFYAELEAADAAKDAGHISEYENEDDI